MQQERHDATVLWHCRLQSFFPAGVAAALQFSAGVAAAVQEPEHVLDAAGCCEQQQLHKLRTRTLSACPWHVLSSVCATTILSTAHNTRPGMWPLCSGVAINCPGTPKAAAEALLLTCCD